MNKQVFLGLIVTLFLMVVVTGSYSMIFGAMNVTTVTSGLSTIETLGIQDDYTLFTKAKGRNTEIGIPAPYLKAFDAIDLGTGVALPGLPTLSMSANGSVITLTGTAYGIDAGKLRYTADTASDPVPGANSIKLEIPGYAIDNKLPAILPKKDKEYVQTFLTACLNLSGSYSESYLQTLDATKLQALTTALFEPVAPATEPLIVANRPKTYSLRLNGANDSVAKESGGKLVTISRVNTDATTIKAVLATHITDAEALNEVVDAVRYLQTGYLYVPDHKFPIDSQKKVPVIRTNY